MTLAEPAASAAAGLDTIQVAAVSRWYGNVVAVNDISFGLGPGITGVLGPNGAGKSTLLHMLAGLLRPSAGSLSVLGQSTWRNPHIYRQVGLVPASEAVYPFLSGFQFVKLSGRLHGLPDPGPAAIAALRAMELEDVMDRPSGGYSKGMNQRLKLAAAIVHEPAVLLLDEPFNGTDPRQRLRMMDMLRAMAAEGRTVLFSSHILEEVERLADKVLVLVAGRLAAAGDFHEIRRLMTDRPHSFMLKSSDDRRLAAALLAEPSVFGLEIGGDGLTVRASDFGRFCQAAPRVARDAGISVLEFRPTDESLESVFSYLVQR